jgi:hypothetical protein
VSDGAMAIYVDATIVLESLFGGAKTRPPPMGRAAWVGSELLEVELFRSVDAMRLAGTLSDMETAKLHRNVTQTLSKLHLFPVSDEVIHKARSPFPIPVRALHALHAATAEVIASETGPLEFWTRDTAQAAAAVTLGLEVRGLDGRAKH